MKGNTIASLAVFMKSLHVLHPDIVRILLSIIICSQFSLASRSQSDSVFYDSLCYNFIKEIEVLNRNYVVSDTILDNSICGFFKVSRDSTNSDLKRTILLNCKLNVAMFDIANVSPEQILKQHNRIINKKWDLKELLGKRCLRRTKRWNEMDTQSQDRFLNKRKNKLLALSAPIFNDTRDEAVIYIHFQITSASYISFFNHYKLDENKWVLQSTENPNPLSL